METSLRSWSTKLWKPLRIWTIMTHWRFWRNLRLKIHHIPRWYARQSNWLATWSCGTRRLRGEPLKALTWRRWESIRMTLHLHSTIGKKKSIATSRISLKFYWTQNEPLLTAIAPSSLLENWIQRRAVSRSARHWLKRILKGVRRCLSTKWHSFWHRWKTYSKYRCHTYWPHVKTKTRLRSWSTRDW